MRPQTLRNVLVPIVAVACLAAQAPAVTIAHAKPSAHAGDSTQAGHSTQARRSTHPEAHRRRQRHPAGAKHRKAETGRVSTQTPAWPGNPFSPTSVWNAALRNSGRVSPNSRALTQDLVQQVHAYGPWLNTWQYSTPVYLVGPGQPTVHVTLDTWAPDLQSDLDSVPIPARARAALGTDEQMTVWQPSTNRMWEFWKMQLESDGWHARWGGEMNDVSGNRGYFTHLGPTTNWGATATGLPLLGGLITFADLKRGYINHALAMAIPHTEARYWAWPAQRTDGSTYSSGATAIPEGTRFRLDPKLDIASLGLPRLTRMIARAAQRYGIIIRDKAGAVTFYGQTATTATNPWGSVLTALPSKLLAWFPWSHLQALPDKISCCWSPS